MKGDGEEFTFDGSWLYRVNLAAEQGDGFKHDTDFKRTYLAPQIEWSPSSRTFVRTGLEYQKNDRSWAHTYGTIGDENGPVQIPMSTNLHDKDDHYKDDSLSWHLKWGHEFNEIWSLTQRITYVDRNSVARGTSLSAADNAGNYTRRYWGWEDETNKIASTNLDLVGKFSTRGIKHTLLAGADYFDEDYDSGGWAFGGTALATNIFNPNNVDAPTTWITPSSRTGTRTRTWVSTCRIKCHYSMTACTCWLARATIRQTTPITMAVQSSIHGTRSSLGAVVCSIRFNRACPFTEAM